MASAMTATTPSKGMVVSISGSGLLDGDALDDVGHLLERVGGVLEPVDDGLDLDQVDRVGRVVEEGRHHLAVERVGLVLEAVDLDPVALEVLHRAQARHGLGGHLGHPGEDLELLGEAVGDLTHAVEHDEVGGLLDVVHAVVEGRGEVVDVLAVEGGDELVRRVVRSVLEVLEAVCHGLPLRGLDLEEPGQLAGRLDEKLGRGGEESEKAGVLGCEAKTHGAAPVDRGLVRGRCYGVAVTPTQPIIIPTCPPPVTTREPARCYSPESARAVPAPWKERAVEVCSPERPSSASTSSGVKWRGLDEAATTRSLTSSISSASATSSRSPDRSSSGIMRPI